VATTAGLALVQVMIETAFYTGLAYVVARARPTFRSSRVRRRIDAVLGTVLVGLGVRVALSSR
jgi:threonine/homoserine/homoserine lactone efflux protein